jgi:hypothetical protein
VVLRDEILNSAVFWEHLRAGFVGIETWLFFGPHGGADHPMIWSHWSDGRIVRTGKYEIFKQVVNYANGGNYVDITMPPSSTITSAFVKDNVPSIWILNTDTTSIADMQFGLGSRLAQGKAVDVVRWHETLPNTGESSSFTATQQHGFTYNISGESLYFFRINLAISASLHRPDAEHLGMPDLLRLAADGGSFTIHSRDNGISGTYALRNMQGMTIKAGVLKGVRTTISTIALPRAMYVITVQTNQGTIATRLLLK